MRTSRIGSSTRSWCGRNRPVRSVSRWRVWWRGWRFVGVAFVGAACGERSPRDATLQVSYFALGTPLEDGMPLRVTVGAGEQARSVRGIELMNRYPFLMSQEARLDSGVTLPVTVAMVNVPHDTLAQARLTLGPVEPATRYTIGATVSRRRPAAFGECGTYVAVPLRPDGGVRDDSLRVGGSRNGDARDSLFVSVHPAVAGSAS